jgi:hypothetical protein
MPRSKAKRSSGSSSRGGGKRGGSPNRLQTLGIFVTVLAVAALVGSLIWGALDYWKSRKSPAAAPPAVPAADARPVPAAAPSTRVRVQVLNATTTAGLARTATNVLRERGFDVVETGNAPRGTAPQSVVIDRVGNLEQARQAADALGISRVESSGDPSLILEVTVVLGSDWRAPAN